MLNYRTALLKTKTNNINGPIGQILFITIHFVTGSQSKSELFVNSQVIWCCVIIYFYGKL